MLVIKGNPIRSFYIAGYLQKQNKRQNALLKHKRVFSVHFLVKATRLFSKKYYHVIIDVEFTVLSVHMQGKQQHVFCMQVSLTETCKIWSILKKIFFENPI